MAANDTRAVQVSPREWWGRRRLRYNIGLIVAGPLAFACYVMVVSWGSSIFAGPHPTVTLWAEMVLPVAVGYLVLMAIDNVFYCLGPLLERIVQPGNVRRYRQTTYRLGFWFSVLVPFTIPAVVACFCLASVLVGYAKPVGGSELPGIYVADYGFATDMLTIKGDRHFIQEVKVRSTGKVVVAKGAWSYDPKDRYISLDGMMGVVDYAGQMVPNFDKKMEGTAVLPVRRLLGKLEIGGDDIPWGREGADIPHTRQANRPSKNQP